MVRECEAMRLASRTRCSVLSAMRSIVRTMHRTAGTQADAECAMDPGSAAHRHSPSKTHVNALMALRSIRGTHSSS
jgi:hypothetical protein